MDDVGLRHIVKLTPHKREDNFNLMLSVRFMRTLHCVAWVSWLNTNGAPTVLIGPLIILTLANEWGALGFKEDLPDGQVRLRTSYAGIAKYCTSKAQQGPLHHPCAKLYSGNHTRPQHLPSDHSVCLRTPSRNLMCDALWVSVGWCGVQAEAERRTESYGSLESQSFWKGASR